MTYFIKSGSVFRQTSEENLELFRYLPLNNYVVKYNKINNYYYLEKTPLFQVPEKLYGNVEALCDRILTTYSARNTSLGVLLSGQKGSGKSLLAKLLSVRSQKPTVIVNECFDDAEFVSFIQSIETPSVIIFDEFEKHYDRDSQNSILTLLDGTAQSNHLYVLTANEKYRISLYFINRPGRVYYNIDYSEVDVTLLRDYISDNLNNQDYAEELFLLLCSINCNFDQVQSVVCEMNRYKESPREAMKWMNIEPSESTHRSTYTVKSLTEGLEVISPQVLSIDLNDEDDRWQIINISVNDELDRISLASNNVSREYYEDGVLLKGMSEGNHYFELHLIKVKENRNKFDNYRTKKSKPKVSINPKLKESIEDYNKRVVS